MVRLLAPSRMIRRDNAQLRSQLQIQKEIKALSHYYNVVL